ncbi:MAG: hypothetical protein R3F61_25895 [Myxococcota bacterium]
MVILGIGLALAETSYVQRLEQTESAWNDAWNAHNRSRIKEILSPEYATIRSSARDVRTRIDQLATDTDWNRAISEHGTPGCKLAATIELDALHVDGVWTCTGGWTRVHYDRETPESIVWRRGSSLGFESVPDEGFLAGPTRYAWHLFDKDDAGWNHYRSAGAVGTRLAVRRSEGPCPRELAAAVPASQRGSAGYVLTVAEDVAVRSTASDCWVYARSPEPVGLSCPACRLEEGGRLLQLMDRLRWAEPGVAGELARGAQRRAPANTATLDQMVSLGRTPKEATLPAGAYSVEHGGLVVAVEAGPITLLDEGLAADGLIRGARIAPVVFGARDLEEGRFALTVPIDVVALAAEAWVGSLGLPAVEARPQEDGSLVFVSNDEPIVEVHTFEEGTLLRFEQSAGGAADLAPLPTPRETDWFRAMLSEAPAVQASFELPAGRQPVEPLWACPLDGGCATGGVLFDRDARVELPESWLPAMEACWATTRPVSGVIKPEATLKVKSRLGARVFDFAGDRVRTEGRLYASDCLVDEGRRLRTWLSLHVAYREVQRGKALGGLQLLDAWGNGVTMEGSGSDTVLISLGSDGKPGGDGAAEDLRYPAE